MKAGESGETRLWTERLHQLWYSRSLRTAFQELLQRRNVTPEEVYVVAPHANPNADLFLLVEELLDFDETMLLWRIMHVRIVERAIGPILPGTGNSSGVSHLEKASATRRFFPELWQLRTRLWEHQAAYQAPGEHHAGCPRAASMPTTGSAHE